MKISFKDKKEIDIDKLEKLYADVGWSAYTNDMIKLQQALINSQDVLSAWEDDELVGLIRTVGDRLTILYIQDILVLTNYQNKGIATQLMQEILKRYKHVRQKVLLTEEAADVRRFYERNNFTSCDQGNAVAFGKFN